MVNLGYALIVNNLRVKGTNLDLIDWDQSMKTIDQL